MNASPSQSRANNIQAAWNWWLWVCLAILVSFAAITQHSLWNDEALTAIKAAQPDLTSWWRIMFAEKASDLQMPLYMIYMWAFAKIFGVSEFALRAANVPWFVGGFTAFMVAMPGPKKLSWAFIGLASPFAWYYLSEARPYAMQLGASLTVFAALYHLGAQAESGKDRPWFGLFFLGLIFLSGSSLLGMIWASAACLATPVVWSWKRIREFGRTQIPIWLPAFILLTGIACYYLWTLKQGARASDVGKTDARNVMFIAYELLGFGGLGPGRLQIREEGLRSFVPFAKWLVVCGVLICDLLILGGWKIYHQQKPTKLVALILIIRFPMAVILGAGWVKEFRVLGRHFTPLLPVILFALGTGLKARLGRPHWASRPLAAGFVVLSMVSCLAFRFAPRHERDDYRGAGEFAKAALQSDQTVWWIAGQEGASYYKVPLADEQAKKNQALWVANLTPEMVRSLTPADLIIFSRPDVYDGRGAFVKFLAQGAYFKLATLPAFTIWQRRDNNLGPPPPATLTREFN